MLVYCFLSFLSVFLHYYPLQKNNPCQIAVPVLYYLSNLCWCGAMAAQLICNQWVAGSTPVTSSKKSRSGTLIPRRLLLLCFCFRHKNPKIPQKMLTNYHPGGNIYRQSMDCKTEYGRVPEWPMGTDCKSAAFSFGGSNPPAPTKQEKSEPVSDWRRVRIFRFLRVQQ